MKLALPVTFWLAASAAVAQIPCWDSNYGTPLTLGDDAYSGALPLGFTFNYNGIAYTDVDICSNGFIVFGTATGSADWTPTVTELTTGPDARVCPNWRDLSPNNGGQVYYNAVAASGGNPAYFSVTFIDVPQYFNTGANTFQVLFIDGDTMQMSYNANCANATNSWLVGASEGNAAIANPVSFAALPIVTAGNPTLHENGTGGQPLADTTVTFIPDGIGGYVVTPASGCATKSTYGSGCVASYASVYEYIPSSPAFDLSNTGLMGIFTGSSYVLTQSASAFMPPSLAATNLNLADDASTVITPSAPFAYPGGTATTLEVCSNGYISVGPNGTAYNPDVANWLGWANPAWTCWHDFQPTATNNVWHEEIGGIVYVTWDAVQSFSTTNPNTFQFQMDTSNGFWHLVWQTMDNIGISTTGDDYLIGYTPGNGAADPGSIDLSPVVAGTASAQTDPSDLLPLRLDADGQPVVGTTINLVTSNITPTAQFGAILLGLNRLDPGISLGSIGMDNCYQHNELAASMGIFLPAGAPSLATPFTVPVSGAGITFQAQAATYDPASGLTMLGGLSSNGLELQFGN